MDITQARALIGVRVRYSPWLPPTPLTLATWTAPRDPVGWISSVGPRFVHVRYGTDCHTKATRPEDLVLADR